MEKIVEAFIALNSDDLIDQVLTIVHDVDFKIFKMISFVRFLLVANENQTILFLNDLFEILISKKFLSDSDEDFILKIFSYCMIKLSSDLAEDRRSSLEIQHLNWFIEFISFLKKYAKEEVSAFKLNLKI